MRNLEFSGIYGDQWITIKQVQKRTAEKMFQAGETIYMQSSNFRPFGVWSQCIEINNKNGETFESIVNSYEYYNCNDEAGKYAVFYKRVK